MSAFPVPGLLAMDAAGLEISEHSVKYLQFTKGRVRRIGKYGNRDIASGIIVGGEIQDITTLAEALRALKSEIGTYPVHVSLPEQKGYIFRMDVPKAADLSLREAVEFRLEEHVPLSPADVVFDFELLPGEDEKGEVSLVVTVFPKTTIEAYYEAIAAAGFLPLSFEIESQAAARSLIPHGDTKVRMIVDFGETRTAIAVVDRGVVRFTTSLELAGGTITAALKTALHAEAGDIERLKNEEGLVGKKSAEAIMGSVAALRDEINRHFVYWHTHNEAATGESAPIASVILCGGNANLRGLPEYLSQTMRAPAYLGEVWQNAFPMSVYVPPIPRNQSLRYATVAGLALRGGIHNA